MSIKIVDVGQDDGVQLLEDIIKKNGGTVSDDGETIMLVGRDNVHSYIPFIWRYHGKNEDIIGITEQEDIMQHFDFYMHMGVRAYQAHELIGMDLSRY